MKPTLASALILLVLSTCSEKQSESIRLPIQKPVEILRDQWGINHIYASTQSDLFFAQGYAAARDRLFQFEVWRRQATGTVAEILGERALKRDIGTRLFRYRGDMQEEMNYYHEDGAEIITAYTQGVNAYISEINSRPEDLPMQFKALGIKPEHWTPDVVISRHQGLLGNIGQELRVGRAVAKLGVDEVKKLYWFHPKDPDLSLDPSISEELLSQDILGLYNAYRKSVKFQREDILPAFRSEEPVAELLLGTQRQEDSLSIGSNNWVVSGAKTKDGNTYMANDPHRTIAIPSLRYMAHLVGPGWNVIGGGEPEIPGISIGHNEVGSWGLTVFRTDGEDLYVYDLNPKNHNQYKYLGEWVDFEVLSDTFKIKNGSDTVVNHLYSTHGPVTFVDRTRLKAFAVRCAWLEPGGSPYLASLRMDQAQSWEEFRNACNYSHIPGENMIWADKFGNIGWQAVGIAPIRKHHSGLVPVPGDGRYEWSGYLPIIEKPNDYNPEKGFIATANENVTPESYTRWDAVGYSWSDPYRGDRVSEVLGQSSELTMENMKALQVDYYSKPAAILTPLLESLEMEGRYQEANQRVSDWDYELRPTSVAAGIYVAWETALVKNAHDKFVPAEAKAVITTLQLHRVIQWLIDWEASFESEADRNAFLAKSFVEAVDWMTQQLGSEIDNWQYGQERYKHTYVEHALGAVVNDEWKEQLNVGPLPRGGNGYTPGSTGNNYRQSHGASFRMIVNTGDWDGAIGTNSPGQSGDVTSPFYSNLFSSWAKDEYFPVYFSREKIEEVTVDRVNLIPLE